MDTSAHASLGHETLVPSGIRAGLDVVVIGINYAPELAGIGPYTAGLAQHYAEQGHRVRVVTGVPHYPDWRRQRVNDPDRIRGNPTVARYRHFVPGRPDVFRRTLYEFTWLASASRSLIGSRADAIVGVIPSLSGGLLAFLLAKKLRRPYGLVFQDLLGSAASQSGYSGAGSLEGIARLIETFLARRANGVAIVADGFRSYLEVNGVSASRIHRVRNWARANLPSETVAQTRLRFGWVDTDLICLHAGNMGQKQGLDNLVRAAQLVSGTQVKIVLAGGGNDKARLVALARNLKLVNVTFLGLQPEGLYESMLRAADVLIVNQRPSVEDMSLPSKLTSYMAAGRPIVAAVSARSETARELEASGAAVIVSPDDPAELASSLLYLAGSSVVRGRLVDRGKEYAQRYLGQGRALQAFDSFLDHLVSSRQPEHATR